jgi:hypothetical protein
VEQRALVVERDLSSQVPHVHVDDVALGVEVKPPHVLRDHLARQDAPGIAQEIFEERVLPRRELDATLAARRHGGWRDRP